jgi:DNA-binding GntR family transcriptional regulator
MGLVVRTLAEQTYEWVRRRILSGEMPPGFQLRQDTIALELGCSKIPLREALTRLEQDGLLSSYPNRGYVVRPLFADEAREVFALRLKLEPAAAGEAARRAGDAERLAAALALQALEDDQTTSEAGDHVARNRAFHLALIRPGGLVTCQLLERLHILAERYVRVHLEPLGREDRARQEHREMFNAWMERDGARVETLTASHLRQTMEDLQQQLAA